MEQYLGLSKETIIQMRADYTKQLVESVAENTRFPADGHLYVRVRNLTEHIRNLTNELAFRNDEIIKS